MLWKCFLKLPVDDGKMEVKTVAVKKSEARQDRQPMWQQHIGVVLVSPVSCSQTLDIITQWIMMAWTHTVVVVVMGEPLSTLLKTINNCCKMLHRYTQTAGRTLKITVVPIGFKQLPYSYKIKPECLNIPWSCIWWCQQGVDILFVFL